MTCDCAARLAAIEHRLDALEAGKRSNAVDLGEEHVKEARMSRSGYSDDLDSWALIRWRGAVTQALRGKRGQQFLRELIAALEAMPVKELIAGDLERDGEVCALGSLGKQRGLDMTEIDPDDHEQVAHEFGIAHALACEVMFENDEWGWGAKSREDRWAHMYRWAKENLRS